jgi:hypothetical protein
MARTSARLAQAILGEWLCRQLREAVPPIIEK